MVQFTNVDLFWPIYVYLLWPLSGQRLSHVHVDAASPYDNALTGQVFPGAWGNLDYAGEDTHTLEHVFLFRRVLLPTFQS